MVVLISSVISSARPQDVLFGRGGLTNHHIGNLRYRDIISIHRQDYIRAQKIEKPNVARRIVKAIRTGLNPGRFLKKRQDGKWHQVSDKEAAWKASQALREKTRWSSMRQDKSDPESPATATGQEVAEPASTITAENAKKRSALDEGVRVDYSADAPSMKRFKSEEAPAALPPQRVETFPTDISHIAVPPVAIFEARKVGYMLPNMNTDSTDFFPRDEDVLFGRGGRTNHHPGNMRLRDMVNKYRHAYNQAKKVDKPQVSRLIVSALRKASPPSRFLRHNEETGRWEDVGDKRAAEKVSQTLREKDQDAKADYVARKTELGTLSETQASEETAYAKEVDEIPLPSPMPSPEKAVTIGI